MAFKLVFLPPQRETTRQWAGHVAEAVPEANVIVADTDEDARREIVDAEAAFGTISAEVLERAARLRWLQAPAIAPPAGYYYPELVARPAINTLYPVGRELTGGAPPEGRGSRLSECSPWGKCS